VKKTPEHGGGKGTVTSKSLTKKPILQHKTIGETGKTPAKTNVDGRSRKSGRGGQGGNKGEKGGKTTALNQEIVPLQLAFKRPAGGKSGVWTERESKKKT